MAGTILVVGAAGTLGAVVVEHLLAAGAQVRTADLDAAALGQRWPAAAAVPLDLTDAATFAPALDEVDRLFLVRPPAIARVGPTLNAFVDHAVAAGVQHVVFSSVAGADRNPVVPHHRVEQHLQRTGLPWTMLRPTFFAQNLLTAYRADIAEDDRLYVPAGDGRVAFVDTRDISEVAARILLDPRGHEGRGYLLTGPRALTFEAVASLLSERLDRPVRYEPASVVGYLRHLGVRGLPLAQRLVQTVLHVGLRRGDAETVDPTLATLLGRPARDIGATIDDHAAAFARSTLDVPGPLSPR